MHCKSYPAVLVLLVLLYTDVTVLEAVLLREMCECLKTVDRLPWRLIADFQVIRSPLCSNVQIVVKLKTNEKICLNPDLRQGQRIQKCWDRRTDTVEPESCIPLLPK
ncbi:alveolar macrophage chemotactic factor 2-like isoform X1 [Arapaima gigas]